VIGAVFRSARVGDPPGLVALGALPLAILPRLVALGALLDLPLLAVALARLTIPLALLCVLLALLLTVLPLLPLGLLPVALQLLPLLPFLLLDLLPVALPLLPLLPLLLLHFLPVALLLLPLLPLLLLPLLPVALLLLPLLPLLAVALHALPVLPLLLLNALLLLALLLVAALLLLALLPLRAIQVLPLSALLLLQHALLLTLLHPRLLNARLLHLTAAAASHATTTTTTAATAAAPAATLFIPARAKINRAIGICAGLLGESGFGDCKRRNAKEGGRDDRHARQTRQSQNLSHGQVPLSAPSNYCRSRAGRFDLNQNLSRNKYYFLNIKNRPAAGCPAVRLSGCPAGWLSFGRAMGAGTPPCAGGESTKAAISGYKRAEPRSCTWPSRYPSP
jgi:hypothetical protein